MFVKKKGEGSRFIKESIEHLPIPCPTYSSAIVAFINKLQPVSKQSPDHSTDSSIRNQSKWTNKGKPIFTLFRAGFFDSLSTSLSSLDILQKEDPDQRSSHISANKIAANLC
jgi:hypothetical protein